MNAAQLLMAFGFAISTAAADAQGIDWSKIDATFGRTAALSGEIHRYGFPRTDSQVTNIRPEPVDWRSPARYRWRTNVIPSPIGRITRSTRSS
jgi:hypothetical protein